MKMYNKLPHWAMRYSNINKREDRMIIIIGLRHHLCVHVYGYTYIELYDTHIYAYTNAYIHTHAHTQACHLRSGAHHKVWRPLVTPFSPTSVSVHVYTFNSVWRKIQEGREAWTWKYGRNHSCYCHYFRPVLENTFPNALYIGWRTTAKQEEIHNIKGTLWKWKCLHTYFLFFPVLLLIHHIPDNWQDEKLKELIWFLPLILFICFMFLPKLRENLDSPSPYGFSFISSNGLARCKLAFSSSLIKSL